MDDGNYQTFTPQTDTTKCMCIYVSGRWIILLEIDKDFSIVSTYFWAIYSDLSRGHPKWWFSKGIPHKMALNQVKDLFHKLARYLSFSFSTWRFTTQSLELFMLSLLLLFSRLHKSKKSRESKGTGYQCHVYPKKQGLIKGLLRDKHD